MAGRPRKYLNAAQLIITGQALTVAEEVVADWFHLTSSSWKQYKYDVRTLKDLSKEEISPTGFAQIVRYGRPGFPAGLRQGISYRICLQDHNILKALRREPDLKLFPLMIYVLTHELVHIVRFGTFRQFFDADQKDREIEEARVHQLTYDLLRPVKVAELSVVTDLYSNHRELF